MIQLRLMIDIWGEKFEVNPFISSLIGDSHIFSKLSIGDKHKNFLTKSYEIANYGSLFLQEPKYHEIELNDRKKLEEYIRWYPNFIQNNSLLFEKYLAEDVDLWVEIFIDPNEGCSFKLFDFEMLKVFVAHNMALPISVYPNNCDLEDETDDDAERVVYFKMSLDLSGEDFKAEEFLKELPEKVHINSKQSNFLSLSHPDNIIDIDEQYKERKWCFDFIKKYNFLLKKQGVTNINVEFEFHHLYNEQCNSELFLRDILKELCEQGIPISISVKVQSRFYKSSY